MCLLITYQLTTLIFSLESHLENIQFQAANIIFFYFSHELLSIILTRDTFAILGGLDIWKDNTFFFEVFQYFPNGILKFRSVWPSRPPRCSLFICLVFGIRCVWHAALKVVCFDFYPTPITSGIKAVLISESFSILAQIYKNRCQITLLSISLVSVYGIDLVPMFGVWAKVINFLRFTHL